jgi:hypothetical protein
MAFPPIEPFFLVGGTALALQLGHRVSIDLDLFTPQPFDKELLLNALFSEFDISVESEGDQLLLTYIEEIKVDFVKMGYPILYPTVEIEEIRLLDIKDVAAMKLKAIAQRGSKKDFYDIYFLSEILPLAEMLTIFKTKFAQFEVFHIVKSLTYFEDAENFADPIVFDKKVSWTKVKKSIADQVKMLI